mmetsp:Transcript_16171/g.15555  ORF Transcript_16171/g.15555 Transcript_16171/m.15555 type:complete len:108 (-) Transcript_16171:279-602(-)
MKTFLLLLLPALIVGAEVVSGYDKECIRCLNASSSYYYSCHSCYNESVVNSSCGWSINHWLQCPKLSFCQNALVNELQLLGISSNYYSVGPGDSCLVQIENGISAGT